MKFSIEGNLKIHVGKHMNEIHEVKFIKTLEKIMFTSGYILHRLNSLLGTILDFFLALSTILPAHASLWPEGSGTTT